MDEWNTILKPTGEFQYIQFYYSFHSDRSRPVPTQTIFIFSIILPNNAHQPIANECFNPALLSEPRWQQIKGCIRFQRICLYLIHLFHPSSDNYPPTIPHFRASKLWLYICEDKEINTLHFSFSVFIIIKRYFNMSYFPVGDL